MQLPNNCHIKGKICVSPRNWESVKADADKKWEIFYTFCDGNLKQEKFVRVKNGLNRCATLQEKQEFVRNAIEQEKFELMAGYNPITGTEPKISDPKIITFKSALEFAFNKIKVVDEYRAVIKSTLNYIYPAMEALGFDNLPIQEVSRKHIKQTLEKCGELKLQTDISIGKTGRTRKGTWNNSQYNAYRKDLHKLFADMIDEELLENNPVTNIKKQKTVITPRRQLTIEEWEMVIKHLNKNYPEFGRFTTMFLLSGSRIIEMLAIRKEDIKLYDHQFFVTVRKGKIERKEPRTIRDEILEQWKYIYDMAKPGEYIFGERLVPQLRNKSIRREQITRRWEEHVKKKLNIPADIYSLKHSNLDDIAEKISLLLAQKAAGHLSPDTTSKYYVPGQKKREHEVLRSIPSKFSLN